MIVLKDSPVDETGTRRKISRRVQEKWDNLAIFKDDRLVLMKFYSSGCNQSDVYETNSPDENQNYDIKEGIKDINHMQTNVFEKYKPHLSTSSIKLSSKLDKPFETVHKLRNEYLELAAPGEKETLLQKYYRIMLETEELIQEMKLQKEDDNGLNVKLLTNIGFQVQSIFARLYTNSNVGYFEQLDSSKTSEICNLRNCIANKLLNAVLHNHYNEEFNILGNISQVLNIKVVSRPNKLKINQSPKICQLEERLQKLETIIGSEKFTLKRLGVDKCNGVLIEDVCSLREITQINIPQINVIEPRFLKLLLKLEHIATKLKYQNEEINEKVNELHDIIFKSREESHLLSNVIKRMTILNMFSHEAGTFVDSINNLNAQHTKVSVTLENSELLLKNVEMLMNKNIVNVVSNLQSLSVRVEDFVGKLKDV